MKFFIFILFFSLSVSLYSSAQLSNLQDTISKAEPMSDEMINAINSYGTTWKAGRNFVGLTLDDVKKFFVNGNENNTYAFTAQSFTNDIRTASVLDARSRWPNCPSIGQIFEQTSCTPSWLISSVGQVADRICIQTGKQIDVQTTIDEMMNLYGETACEYNTANIGQVFNYWSKTGIVTMKTQKTDECLPFVPNCPPKEIVRDQKFNFTPKIPASLTTKMTDMTVNGPLTASIEIYSDFLNYKSGIYQKISTQKIGTHTLKVIGYGTENGIDYWLAANSWGTQWGDNGTIKIHKGSGQFGYGVIFISAELTPTEMSDSKSNDPLFYLQ